jgi:hypothetical protein
VEADDDDMNFTSSAPKKKPPPGLGKKPVKKAKPDADMKDEEEKKPASSTVKRAAPTKGPVAPVIQDEDLGSFEQRGSRRKSRRILQFWCCFQI